MSLYTDFYPVGGTAATLAEAAAGTIDTKYLSPKTGVPKDAAGMTGAAILPSGTVAQRPSSPTTGMLRFNSNTTFDATGYAEVFTKDSKWRQLAYTNTPATPPADLVFSANQNISGTFYCNNLTVNAGVTLTVNSGVSVLFFCTGAVTIDGSIVADGTCPRLDAQNNGGSGFLNYIPGIGYGWAGGNYIPSVVFAGSSPGTGRTFAGAGGSVLSALGGAGGGGIAIRSAGPIVMGAGGSLSARGVIASTAVITSNTGNETGAGAGGGSGGVVVLHSDQNITLSGTIDVRGGNGCTGFTSAGNATGCGGGGGGGGWVILQTPGTLTNGAVSLLSGGGGGVGSGPGPGLYRGMAGAGFGGQGGPGGQSVGSPDGSNGSDGFVTFSGSPF